MQREKLSAVFCRPVCSIDSGCPCRCWPIRTFASEFDAKKAGQIQGQRCQRKKWKWNQSNRPGSPRSVRSRWNSLGGMAKEGRTNLLRRGLTKVSEAGTEIVPSKATSPGRDAQGPNGRGTDTAQWQTMFLGGTHPLGPAPPDEDTVEEVKKQASAFSEQSILNSRHRARCLTPWASA